MNFLVVGTLLYFKGRRYQYCFHIHSIYLQSFPAPFQSFFAFFLQKHRLISTPRPHRRRVPEANHCLLPLRPEASPPPELLPREDEEGPHHRGAHDDVDEHHLVILGGAPQVGVGSATGRGISLILAGGEVVFGPPWGGASSAFLRGERGGNKRQNRKVLLIPAERRQIFGNFEQK